jgi:hypothetical protein
LCTQGESDSEPLLGKCCFFLRNAPMGQPIDTGKEGEPVRSFCFTRMYYLFGRSTHPLVPNTSTTTHSTPAD